MDKPIPPENPRCHLVLTTLPSREAAQAIARTLVEERLAACVQLVDGLLSIYRWEGRIDESAECQLVAAAIGRFNARGTPIRGVMLERLGPNVWHESPAAAMATLEELEETAKLWLMSGRTAEALDGDRIEELRQAFGARW